METIYNVRYKCKFNLEENKDHLKDVFNKKLVNVIINQEKEKISDENS